MKKRYVLSTFLFAALAAWAGAQQGTKSRPRPEERLQLVQRNQGLYKKLVAGSLTLASKSSSALARSESYEDVIRELEAQIKQAAEAGEAGRVAELMRHLTEIVDKGLTPNLEKARKLISKHSPDKQRLDYLLGVTQRMSREIGEKIARSSMANSTEVKNLLGALQSARTKVEKAVALPKEE